MLLHLVPAGTLNSDEICELNGLCPYINIEGGAHCLCKWLDSCEEPLTKDYDHVVILHITSRRS